MVFKALKDIAHITMGQSPESESYNDEEVGMPFFQGNADFGEVYPNTRVWCSSPKKIAEPGDILISVRAPIGALNYAKERCCIGRGLAAISIKEEAERNYVFHLLKAKNKELNAKGTGSTFKAIGKNVLEEIQIPQISANEQQKCMGIMDSLESVIRKRRVQLFVLDKLIKSRFVEMFGTYPRNEKGWKVGKIRDLVSDVRYGSSRKAAEGNSGQYQYLRMNNITYSGELDLSDVKTIDIPDGELEKCTVKRGDLLFNRTNSKELVGKTCVYNRDEQMVLAGFIVRVRMNDKALPEFVSAFMNTDFSKQMLLGMCKAAIGQANINAQELQNIGIYIPPVEIQNKFIEFKAQIDKSKVAVQKSLEDTQLLFDKLMQEYFG
jgi:type I restriction enzyme S subunit